ncbi:uncharacterized protein LOC128484556 isoform X2 [Spea bombifrons]|uniref:uncharacterized protein LOC128484556 isoform X2 n=1 Tax=Spea bombifrons TaxID=233779 RepID=UPI00234AF9E2|nr:uncharacterized protein LOC128484556 isoform X2 [Spea bombifrons]
MDTCITIFGIEEKRTILFFRNGLINSSQELCEDRCIGELQNRAMRHITLHLQQKPVTHPAETTIQTNHMKDKILHLEEELKKKDEAIAKLERHLASMRIFHQQVLNIPEALQTWNSKMKIMCCKSFSPTTEAELQWVQSKVQEKTLVIDSIRKMKAERTSQRKSENDEMIENLNLDYSIIEEEILLSNLKVQKRFLKECQTNWKEWKALEVTQAAGGVVI